MREAQLRDESEEIRAVYDMAFFDCGALNLAIGDLVITNQSIVFLWYTEVLVKGNAGGLVGTAVGGAGLGLVSAISDQGNISAAMEGIAMLQEKIYGLSLQQRLERFSQSQQFRIQDVAGVSIQDEQTIEVTLKNAEKYSYHFRYKFAEQYKDFIRNWPSDACPYDSDEDVYGFYLGTDSPSTLLDLIVSGDSAIGEKLAALSGEGKYVAGLYNELGGYTKEQCAQIYDSLSLAPREFQDALKEEAKKESSSAFGSIFSWLFFGSIMSAASFYRASEGDGGTMYTALGVGIVIVALVFAVSEIGPIRENARIKAALN